MSLSCCSAKCMSVPEHSLKMFRFPVLFIGNTENQKPPFEALNAEPEWHIFFPLANRLKFQLAKEKCWQNMRKHALLIKSIRAFLHIQQQTSNWCTKSCEFTELWPNKAIERPRFAPRTSSSYVMVTAAMLYPLVMQRWEIGICSEAKVGRNLETESYEKKI